MFLILTHSDALTPAISEQQNDESADKLDPPLLQNHIWVVMPENMSLEIQKKVRLMPATMTS